MLGTLPRTTATQQRHVLQQQSTATYCNTPCAARRWNLYATATPYNTLQHTAIHCNTPCAARKWDLYARQLTATHCNTRQHAAIHYCSTLQLNLRREDVQSSHTATQCTTTVPHCNTLATHCTTLQHILRGEEVESSQTTTHCNTPLQHTATTHCNILQHTATHCNTPCAARE